MLKTRKEILEKFPQSFSEFSISNKSKNYARDSRPIEWVTILFLEHLSQKKNREQKGTRIQRFKHFSPSKCFVCSKCFFKIPAWRSKEVEEEVVQEHWLFCTQSGQAEYEGPVSSLSPWTAMSMACPHEKTRTTVEPVDLRDDNNQIGLNFIKIEVLYLPQT